MIEKIRLDILLSQISEYSRDFSKKLIEEGSVKVDDKIVTKPGIKVEENCKITFIKPKTKYVSRGGYKLKKGLDTFNIKVKDKICLDVGASTGGFTDCLLQNGAKLIYAVDSGYNQMHTDLLSNKKIILMEKTNIKDIIDDNLQHKCNFCCIDVSFISLIKILDKVKSLLLDDSDILILIKPQFELENKNYVKKGIVKNKELHFKVIDKINNFCINIGVQPLQLDYSPIKGSKGNIEYLMHLKKNDIQEQIINQQKIESIVKNAFIKL